MQPRWLCSFAPCIFHTCRLCLLLPARLPRPLPLDFSRAPQIPRDRFAQSPRIPTQHHRARKRLPLRPSASSHSAIGSPYGTRAHRRQKCAPIRLHRWSQSKRPRRTGGSICFCRCRTRLSRQISQCQAASPFPPSQQAGKGRRGQRECSHRVSVVQPAPQVQTLTSYLLNRARTGHFG